MKCKVPWVLSLPAQHPKGRQKPNLSKSKDNSAKKLLIPQREVTINTNNLVYNENGTSPKDYPTVIFTKEARGYPVKHNTTKHIQTPLTISFLVFQC